MGAETCVSSFISKWPSGKGSAAPIVRRYDTEGWWPSTPHGDTDWKQDAACRGADPELFFYPNPGGDSIQRAREAKKVCARCPVRVECLDYAVSTGQSYGVWGGLSPKARRAVRRAS